MIPEIGHFALILALLLALTQGILPIVGAARGKRGVDGAGAPGRAGAVHVCRDRLRLSRLVVS